jgi:hypothetical protein
LGKNSKNNRVGWTGLEEIGEFGFGVLLFDNQLSLLQRLICVPLTDSTPTWVEPLLLPGEAQTKNSPNAKTNNSPHLATTSSLLITASRLLGSDVLHDIPPALATTLKGPCLVLVIE